MDLCQAMVDPIDLDGLRSVCDIIKEEKKHFDDNLAECSKQFTVVLRCAYIRKKDNSCIIHVNKVEVQEDCLAIDGLSIEVSETSIWLCTTYIGFDEFFDSWERVSLKEFKEAWDQALSNMYKTLPKAFPNL